MFIAPKAQKMALGGCMAPSQTHVLLKYVSLLGWHLFLKYIDGIVILVSQCSCDK